MHIKAPALLLALMLCLTGCALIPPPAVQAASFSAPEQSVPAEPSSEAASMPNPEPEPPPEPEPVEEIEEEPEEAREAPVPDEDWNIKELVYAYFDEVYYSYANFTSPLVENLLIMDEEKNENLVIWLETLALRRRLLYENGLCFVDREIRPYEISFGEEPEDERMYTFRREMKSGDKVLHLTVTGEEGEAYPPTLAVNSQHSFILRKVDDVWQIKSHYYAGAMRNFYFQEDLSVPDEDELLSSLQKEFAPAFPIGENSVPDDTLFYDSDAAVDYALMYTEDPNPAFYHVGDWDGNCQNFVSQCVHIGFGGNESPEPSDYDWFAMTNEWFAGIGGSRLEWENVDYFWEYATEGREMGVQTYYSVRNMRAGDVLQIRTEGYSEKGDFNHTFIVIDPDTGLLSQNSPGNFTYYSDLVNAETRFVRPVWLIDE